MIVLGIETSCDETAAAVLDGGRKILSNIVASQDDVHAPYGGIVPELASRRHIDVIVPVVKRALETAGVTLPDIDGIAVTQGPGLVGSLLIGCSVAKAIAYAQRKPIVGVNHLEGHIYAAFLEEHPPAYPFVALVVSGGHTALYAVRGRGRYECIGQTRDDAAGEAFDKVAKLLGLGYPGGPVVDRLAAKGDPTRVQIAPPMPERDSLEFSFSGIKTSVARYVEKNGPPADEQALADLCASFQRRVVDVLVRKAFIAARREKVSTMVLGGGVAANRELREATLRAGAAREIRVVVPPI